MEKNVTEANSNKNLSSNVVKSWAGYTFALLSSIASAAGVLLIKMSPADKMLIVLLRSMIQFILLLPLVTKKKIDILGSSKTITAMLVMRGTLGCITMTIYAVALNFLPAGDATALYHIYPALVMLFACICLKESCGVVNIILTLITMAGFVLVAQPSFIFGELPGEVSSSSFRFIGVLLITIGSILQAFVIVILRKMGIQIHFSQSLLYYSLISVILNVLYKAGTTQVYLMCFESLPIAVTSGMLFFLAQILTTLALQREKAGPVTLIKSSEVVFSYLFQFIFLNEIPNLLSCCGAGLIVFVCVALALKAIFRVMTPRSNDSI